MSTAPPTTGAPTTAPPDHGRDETRDILWGTVPIPLRVLITGGILNQSIMADPIPVKVTITGNFVSGVIINCDPIPIVVRIKSRGITVLSNRCGFIKWSKIGRLDFTIDESNVAGERPMDWAGCVYKILKLGKDSAVVYGANGITVINPSGVNWGMQTIHKLGLMNRTAVDGNDSEHYFIDSVNKLYQVSGQGLKLLDYSEYLNDLVNPKVSIDNSTGLVYICDGEHGYVYSPRTESLGEGPSNVTGIQMQSGTLYVVAPEEIEIPKFHICTDIYDLGTRKPKTIQQLEIGTNLRVGLEAKIDYRISDRNHFDHSAWKFVSPNGIVEIPCYGTEFRFQLRSFIYEYFELDYIRVNGTVHGFTQYLDQIN